MEDSEADGLLFERLVRGLNRPVDLKRWRRAGDLMLQVQQCTSTRPGAIFIDLILPGLDGHWLIKFLRSQPGWDLLPIIALSGHPCPSAKQLSLRLGANQYLSKSVGLDGWRQEVRSSLTRWLPSY